MIWALFIGVTVVDSLHGAKSNGYKPAKTNGEANLPKYDITNSLPIMAAGMGSNNAQIKEPTQPGN